MLSYRLAYLGCSEGKVGPSSRDLACPGCQVDATAQTRPPSKTVAATYAMDSASFSMVAASDSLDLDRSERNLVLGSCDLSRRWRPAPMPLPGHNFRQGRPRPRQPPQQTKCRPYPSRPETFPNMPLPVRSGVASRPIPPGVRPGRGLLLGQQARGEHSCPCPLDGNRPTVLASHPLQRPRASSTMTIPVTIQRPCR